MLCDSPGTFWSDQVREATLSLSDRIATTFPPQCDTYNWARFQQYKLYCPGSGSHLTKFKFCPKRHKVFATPELDGLQFGWPMAVWPIAISFTRESICGGKCYKNNPSTNQWSYFKTKRYPSLRQDFSPHLLFPLKQVGWHTWNLSRGCYFFGLG